MSPKSVPKSAKSARLDYGSWVPDVAPVPINDGEWGCFVAVIVPRDKTYIGLLDELNKRIMEGSRLRVKTISRRTIVSAVQLHCGKAGLRTPYSALCDEIKGRVGIYFEPDVPGDLIPYLVKYMILEEKEKDLKRRAEAEAVAARRDRIMSDLSGAEKTLKGKKGSKEKKGTPEGKGKGKKTPGPPQKIGTKLHTRQEDRKDVVPKLDQPDSSPALFILISDLYDPSLLENLISIGVDVQMFIEFGAPIRKSASVDSYRYDALKSHLEQMSYDALSNARLNKRLKVMPLGVLKEKGTALGKFWDCFKAKFWDAHTCGLYKNVLLTKYSPMYKLEEAGQRLMTKQTVKLLYDDICYLMYDYCDLKSLYDVFLKENVVLKIPDVAPPDVGEFTWYIKVLDAVDPALVDVPLIVDTLVSQVCVSVGEDYGYDLRMYFPGIDDGPVEEVAPGNCAEAKIQELCLKHELFTVEVVNELQQEALSALVAHFGDHLYRRIFSLERGGGLVHDRAVHVLKCVGNALIWKAAGGDALEVCDVHRTLFENALKVRDRRKLAEVILTLRRFDGLDRDFEAVCDEDDAAILTIKENEMVGTMKDVDESSMGIMTGISKCHYFSCDYLKSLAIGKEEKEFFMNEASYFESLTKDVMLQTLLDLLVKEYSLKTLYYPLLETVIARLSEPGFQHKWTAKLQSVVSERDFLQYVVSENALWFSHHLRQMNVKVVPTTDKFKYIRTFPIFDPIRPIVLDENVTLNSFEWVMKDTSKYEAVAKESLEAKEMIYFNRAHDPEINQEPPPEKMDFDKVVLYQLDDPRRKQYNGVEYRCKLGKDFDLTFKLLFQLYEIETASVYMEKENFFLSYHTKMCPNEDRIRLNVILADGMIVSFSEKQTSKRDPVRGEETPDAKSASSEDAAPNGISSQEDTEYGDLTTTFDVSISWPTGLLIGAIKVFEDVAIKQAYTSPGDELFRYILKDGRVLKFMANDSVRILHPCGKIMEVLDVGEERDWNEAAEDGPTGGKLAFLNYLETLSHGKVSHVLNGSTIEKEDEFMEESYDPFSSTSTTLRSDGTKTLYLPDGKRIVTFPDGTRITTRVDLKCEDFLLDWDEKALEEWFTDVESEETDQEPEPDRLSLQSTSFKWLPPDQGDYEPLGSLLDLEVGSWIREKRPKRKRKQYAKIYTLGDGFVVYDASFVVEHPKFARVKVHPDDTLTQLEMPYNTSLLLYDTPFYFSLKFNDKHELRVTKDKFIIQETEGDMLVEETCLFYHVFRLPPNPNNSSPLVWCRRSTGEEVIFSTSSQLYVKKVDSEGAAPNREEEKRYFGVRKSYTGNELILDRRFERDLESANSQAETIVQQYRNPPFLDYLLLRPVRGFADSWTMAYSRDGARPLYSLPSTYGPDWRFPFKRRAGPEGLPRFLEVRYVQQIVAKDRPARFQEALDEYSKLVNRLMQGDREDDTCTCVKPPPAWQLVSEVQGETTEGQVFYEKGNLVLREETPVVLEYLRNKVVTHAAKKALFEKNKERIFGDFKKHKSATYGRKFPGYHESAFGAGHEFAEGILGAVGDRIDSGSDELECLLSLPLCRVTEEQVKEMSRLLGTVPHGYVSVRPGSGYSPEMVIRAGLRLPDKFANVRDILVFHMSSREDLLTLKIEAALDGVK